MQDRDAAQEFSMTTETVFDALFVAHQNKIKFRKRTQSPNTSPDEPVLPDLTTGKVNCIDISGCGSDFGYSDGLHLPDQSFPYWTTSLFL